MGEKEEKEENRKENCQLSKQKAVANSAIILSYKRQINRRILNLFFFCIRLFRRILETDNPFLVQSRLMTNWITLAAILSAAKALGRCLIFAFAMTEIL